VAGEQQFGELKRLINQSGDTLEWFYLRRTKPEIRRF
jgi:hypothetical protein